MRGTFSRGLAAILGIVVLALTLVACTGREYYVNNLYSPDSELRIEAIDELKHDQQTDTEVMKAIIDALSAEDATVAERAAYALLASSSNMPDDALQPLFKCLESDDRFLVVQAMDALSLYKENRNRIRDKIEGLLNHKDAYVRVTALRILGGRDIMHFLLVIGRGPLGDEGSIPRMRKLLDDKDDKVRWTAIVSLGRLKDTGPKEKIRAMATDPNEEVREAVVDYFKLIGAPE